MKAIGNAADAAEAYCRIRDQENALLDRIFRLLNDNPHASATELLAKLHDDKAQEDAGLTSSFNHTK